jgi:hypothetical protein
MSLAEKLAEIRDMAKERFSEEVREMIGRANEALRNSDILDSAIKAGDRLPPFALKNRQAQLVSSEELLKQGNLVLTLYRGNW